MMIVMGSRVGCNLFIQHFLKLYNLYIPNYTLIANVMSQPYFSLFPMSGIGGKVEIQKNMGGWCSVERCFWERWPLSRPI